jgi:hypothetical protein
MKRINFVLKRNLKPTGEYFDVLFVFEEFLFDHGLLMIY